eukprot:6800126-Pyramimonas_sp.AAC.1
MVYQSRIGQPWSKRWDYWKVPRAPSGPQDRQGRPRESPRVLQGCPKRLEDPGGHQEHPRSPQEASNEALE